MNNNKSHHISGKGSCSGERGGEEGEGTHFTPSLVMVKWQEFCPTQGEKATRISLVAEEEEEEEGKERVMRRREVIEQAQSIPRAGCLRLFFFFLVVFFQEEGQLLIESAQSPPSTPSHLPPTCLLHFLE